MIEETKYELVKFIDNELELEVSVSTKEETVWLTQKQMATLFNVSVDNISLHIKNILKEELDKSVVEESSITASDGKKYKMKLYNLDVIISVGYRVKSQRGTQFRQWANKVLKEYLLRGYSINQRLKDLEEKVDAKLVQHERQLDYLTDKVDFFVRTSLPPVEGIFYNGQIFDAYKFAADLIRSAKKSILLIDNYVDESVLLMLSKRGIGVTATIYTHTISNQLNLDIQKHNSQYPRIEVKTYKQCHDRFLIIDDTDVYHIGASLKDLGKKMFAFSKLDIPSKTITDLL